jgi:hypothetical protein
LCGLSNFVGILDVCRHCTSWIGRIKAYIMHVCLNGEHILYREIMD